MSKVLKGAVSFVVLLAIWQALAASGAFPSSLFPGPGSVAGALAERAESGQLLLDVGASMYRFFIGYVAACVTAVLLGLVMGWCTRAWEFLNPVVQFLRPISPVAWLPFIVLWLGHRGYSRYRCHLLGSVLPGIAFNGRRSASYRSRVSESVEESRPG